MTHDLARLGAVAAAIVVLGAFATILIGRLVRPDYRAPDGEADQFAGSDHGERK